MTATTTSIHCSTRPDHGVVDLYGPITRASAFEFERALDHQLGYYHFETIVLRIDSPGGELGALRHMLDVIDGWTDRGRQIHTEARLMAASAGALLLSAGTWGHRQVSPHTELLYHTARMASEQPVTLTSDHAANLARSMAQADVRVIGGLVERLAKGAGGLESFSQEGKQRCERLRTALRTVPPWLKSAEQLYRRMVQSGSSRDLTAMLVKRFAQDLPMCAREAYALGLVDHIGRESPAAVAG